MQAEGLPKTDQATQEPFAAENAAAATVIDDTTAENPVLAVINSLPQTLAGAMPQPTISRLTTSLPPSGNSPLPPGRNSDSGGNGKSADMIVATDLTKWFGEGEAKTTAVQGAGFAARFGEMLFIVGPSGSGKTTLISMLSGILRPNAGSVTIKGDEIWQLDNDALADFRLNTLGFVFQDYHLFPRLTTVENVAIPLILKRRDWDESIAEARKYLDIVGLKNRADIVPVKLSGGEQQRVAIARAIVSSPDILILDEPTASLDGDTGRMIIAFVKEKFLNANRCILIVTHDARINEYADRIMHMEDGRITGFEKGSA